MGWLKSQTVSLLSPKISDVPKPWHHIHLCTSAGKFLFSRPHVLICTMNDNSCLAGTTVKAMHKSEAF